MLTPADLIHLPYSPDLTEGGIAFVCRSLTNTYDRMGSSPFEYLRHSVADVAVELAFRRYFTEQAVPYKVLGAAPFTRPDQYDLSLGGHRCMVTSYLITRHSQISKLRQAPDILLQAPALLTLDPFAGEEHKPDDLYLFAFLLGLVAVTRADVEKAIAVNLPVSLIHLLPEAWSRPENWIPLEKLSLKSDCGRLVTVEIGGQDGEHNFITATLELPPRQRMLVDKRFHSLVYAHALDKPEARIGIHSPQHGKPYLIPPHAWGNLWIYGMDIYLAGWLTHEDFRRKARVLNAGMQTFQYDRTPIKYLQVPVSELNPLGIFLKKVRQWEEEVTRSNPFF
jgi:hypothetical protein